MRLCENEDCVIMRLLRNGEVNECVNATERVLKPALCLFLKRYSYSSNNMQIVLLLSKELNFSTCVARFDVVADMNPCRN